MATLCYIISEGKVLLISKARGFGTGKKNVPGGKVNTGESISEAAVREVYEETGLRLVNVDQRGVLRFYFGSTDHVSWVVYVYVSTSFEGELKWSEEGEAEWVPVSELPFDNMWPDDRVWVPLLLAGRRFEGDFYFDKAAERLLNHNIRILAR